MNLNALQKTVMYATITNMKNLKITFITVKTQKNIPTYIPSTVSDALHQKQVNCK